MKTIGEDVKKLKPVHSRCKHTIVRLLWKTVWKLKKLKIELPYDPKILLLGKQPNLEQDLFKTNLLKHFQLVYFQYYFVLVWGVQQSA